MNSKRTTFPAAPKILVGEEGRPQKKTKVGCHMNVVSVLADIGVSNYSRGDYKAAEECFSQALSNINFGQIDLMVSQLHKETKLSSRKTVAVHRETNLSSNGAGCGQPPRKQQETTPSNTEYDEGMRVYRDLMEIQRSSPLEEVEAMLQYNVGQSFVQMGNTEKATTYFRKSLDKFLALDSGSGVTNPINTVMSLHSLGYCLYRTENSEQANDCYKQALALVSNFNLGTTHLAASVNCIGVLLFNQQNQDNTEVAMQLFSKSLSLYRSGDQVALTSIATVLNNIGRTHYIRSEFSQAHDRYVECIQLRREHLGNNSIDVAATAYNLGQVYYQLGRLDDALPHYEEFLNIMTRDSAVKLSSSKDIALVYKGMAEIYQDKSDCRSALKYYRQALQIQKAACFGSKQCPGIEIASTLNKMGNLCYEMKDFATAMTHYQEGLRVEKEILEPAHPHIIITTTNIGHIHKQLGQYKNALSTYQSVLKLQQTKLGTNDIGLAETLSSIGLMRYHLRDYEASFDSYQDALRIRRQHLQVENDLHPQIASTLNSIGLVLFKQEVFELAKNCFQESLRIRTKLFGKDHREVAILWYNIGTIHFEKGEDDLAIQMYKETLRVERQALGASHPDVVLTLQHLGQVHQQLGYAQQAISYFKEALDIERQRRCGETERALARILNLLGNAYLQIGKTSDMMNCYVEAARIYESNQGPGETLVIGGYNFYGLSKTNPPSAPVA